MPALTQQRIAESEITEWSMTGPFGGIQSEMSIAQIESLGWSDSLNVICDNGLVLTRGPYEPTLPLPTAMLGPVLGMSDFYDLVGARHQVILTNKGLAEHDPVAAAWNLIGGSAFTGSASQLFSYDVCNHKFCFCQGVDPIRYWDGNYTHNYVDITASKPARFLMELETHLISAYTLELGSYYPMRVRWSGAGDPTDYTSFNSGIADILSNLGPISGLAKIYQQGYIWHKQGITQMQPTGLASAPFRFTTFGSKGKGNWFDYSLAAYGEEGAVYIGQEDVFLFDGTQSEPIGSKPVQGARRSGARARIMGELTMVPATSVRGFISSSINGVDYKAYWIVIPGVGIWRYNFDEQNWVRDGYDRFATTVGPFYSYLGSRIMDL